MFKQNKINKDKIFEHIGAFVIVILVTPMLVLLLPNSAYKEKAEQILRDRLPIIVNARVFTSTTNNYSILLGGTVKMTAIKTDGTMEDVSVYFPNIFNHSYAKVKDNLMFGDFDKYRDEKQTIPTRKHKAFRQLFCVENYKSIIVESVTIQQNEGKEEKRTVNIINCKN
jgi:hypothetical protein